MPITLNKNDIRFYKASGVSKIAGDFNIRILKAGS